MQDSKHEAALAAVQQDGWALEYVPEALRTRELCLAAVHQNGWALRFVPGAVQIAHPEIAITAVQQHGWAFQNVSKAAQLAHPEICLAAVQKNGLALRFVSEALKTDSKALLQLATTGISKFKYNLGLLRVSNPTSSTVINLVKNIRWLREFKQLFLKDPQLGRADPSAAANPQSFVKALFRVAGSQYTILSFIINPIALTILEEKPYICSAALSRKKFEPCLEILLKPYLAPTTDDAKQDPETNPINLVSAYLHGDTTPQ